MRLEDSGRIYMKRRNKLSVILFTQQDARVSHDLFDALEDVYSDGAEHLKLSPRYVRLQKSGVR